MSPEPYACIIHSTRWSGWGMLLFGALFILAVVYVMTTRPADVLTLWWAVLLLAVGFLVFLWRAMIQKAPVLKFGRNGLWTPTLGAVKWNQIALKYDRIYSLKSGSFEVLRIIDQASKRQVDCIVLSGLSESSDRLKKLIISCHCSK